MDETFTDWYASVASPVKALIWFGIWTIALVLLFITALVLSFFFWVV